MPVASFQKLIHFPVYTRMGIHLGHLVDIEYDTNQYTIINFIVQQKGLVAGFKKPLVINQSQVVDISDTKIIVEDSVLQEGVTA